MTTKISKSAERRRHNDGSNTMRDDLFPYRIDVENLRSAAITRLEENAPGLREVLDNVEKMARKEAAGHTKAQITSYLTHLALNVAPKRVHIPRPTAKTAEFVDAYVSAVVDNHDAARTLKRLERSAAADRAMAARINQLADFGAEVKEGFERRLKNDGARSAMRWAGDRLYTATTAAEIASGAARAATREVQPMDIREVAAEIAQKAVRTMAALPRHLLANGLAGAGRAEDLYAAVAAQEILWAVRDAYGELDDAEGITINVGRI